MIQGVSDVSIVTPWHQFDGFAAANVIGMHYRSRPSWAWKPPHVSDGPPPWVVERARFASRAHPAIMRLITKGNRHAADNINNCGVYAVTIPGCGRIKIGCTGSLSKRLRSLDTGSPVPVDLLAFIVGSYELEAMLHLQLAAHRVHLEWFRDCPEVRDTLIAAAREHGGIWLL